MHPYAFVWSRALCVANKSATDSGRSDITMPAEGTSGSTTGLHNAPPCVHGVLHKLTATQFRHLTISEGGLGHDGLGYARRPVECVLYPDDVKNLSKEDVARYTRPDGRVVVPALAFCAQDHLVRHYPLYPSQRYARIVAEGSTVGGLWAEAALARYIFL